MAELAQGRLRRKLPVLEQALAGLVRDHHRRWLAIQLAHIDVLAEQIEALSTEIACCLTDLSAAAPPAAPPEPVESTPELSPPGTPLTVTRAIALLDTTPALTEGGQSAGWRRPASIGPALAPRLAWQLERGCARQ